MLVYLSMIEGPEDRNKFEIVYEQYKNLMYYVASVSYTHLTLPTN